MSGPAFVIHSLDHAAAALAAAAEVGSPVTLISGEGAAAYVGAAWFRELVALAARDHPDVPVTAVLDCGDRPGDVLAALRQGLKTLSFSGRRSVAKTLAAVAADYGAELVARRRDALDLLDTPDPAAACRAWIAKTAR